VARAAAALRKVFMALRQANQYDALKCVALVAMTIDHLGFFFFPEQDWLRIIGRAAAPIFLVLVGYNHSFRFRYGLLIAAICVTIADGLLLSVWLAPNILWTILLARMALAYAIPRFARHEILIVSIAAVPFTMPILDFGSLALVFALVGYRLRQRRDRFVWIGLSAGLTAFYAYTYGVILHNPSPLDAMLLACVLAVTGLALWHADYRKPISIAARPVALLAAGSLYYYVGHKLVMEVITLL
jgi:hypothetical protein